jgi:hypothetical protein
MTALSFITGTWGTWPVAGRRERSPTGDQSLSLVGYRRSPQQCFFLERYQLRGDEPALFRMNLTGPWAGRLIPYREAVNENRPEGASELGDLAALGATLRPLKLASLSSFAMTTRVVRHTALMTEAGQPPVRKYAVRVSIRSLDQSVPARHQHLTTYHRPNVVLERVYSVPNRFHAIAIVSYVGTPFELGDRVEQPILIETH